jgi:hypothetical protein
MVQEKINLMTIKWGTKFSADYPNLIHRMAKRQMPCEFNSYCMTDDPNGLDDDIIPVECTEPWLWNDVLSNCQGGEKNHPSKIITSSNKGHNYDEAHMLAKNNGPLFLIGYTDTLVDTGTASSIYTDKKSQWWFWDAIKMSLFAPKLCGIEGKILFSDLDNLFLNRLDRVIQTTPPAIIKTNWNANYHIPMHGGNYFLTMGFNASLIYVDNRSPVTQEIWEHFLRYYNKAKGSLYSSDAYLWRCHRDKINTYPDGTVYSHSRGAKYPDQEKGKYRKDHDVCIFMEDHEPDPLDIKKGWEADLCKQYL